MTEDYLKSRVLPERNRYQALLERFVLCVEDGGTDLPNIYVDASRALGHRPIEPKMSDMERVRLVYDVLDRVIGQTSSILSEAGDLGGQLAYLLGAICNTKCDKPDIELEGDDDVLEAFRRIFPADHGVWDFIDITSEGVAR